VLIAHTTFGKGASYKHPGHDELAVRVLEDRLRGLR
jgi:hypothetical protein